MTPNNPRQTVNMNDRSAYTVLPNGTRVMELRQLRRWTQRRLAAEAIVGARTIWNIEQGTAVRPDTLEAVANRLGVPLESLILDQEGPGETSFADPVPLIRQDAGVSPPHAGPHTPVPPTRSVASLAMAWQARAAEPAGPRRCSLLVVEDDPAQRDVLSRGLASGFDLSLAADVDQAIAIFARRPVDILLTDQEMPGRKGSDLLDWVRQNHPGTICLLMTGYPDLENAIAAINQGKIFHYIPKPWNLSALHLILCNAAEKVEMERKRKELLDELDCRNRELEKINRELLEANRQLQQRTRELELEARNDPLSGLLNRRAIEEMVRFEIRRHARYGRPLSLGLIQIDPLGNSRRDLLSAGSEEILGELGQTLLGSLREVDSIGRLHGELFLVIARETGHDGASRLAERIRARVASTDFVVHGQSLAVTVSVAFVASALDGQSTLLSMVDAVATLLAEVQDSGGNRGLARHLSDGMSDSL